jgi:hypothetical protein
MDVEQLLEAHETRLNHLDDCVDQVGKSVSKLEGSMSTVEVLVKWVITPLLLIVGGLVGVKLIVP